MSPGCPFLRWILGAFNKTPCADRQHVESILDINMNSQFFLLEGIPSITAPAPECGIKGSIQSVLAYSVCVCVLLCVLSRNQNLDETVSGGCVISQKGSSLLGLLSLLGEPLFNHSSLLILLSLSFLFKRFISKEEGGDCKWPRCDLQFSLLLLQPASLPGSGTYMASRQEFQ